MFDYIILRITSYLYEKAEKGWKTVKEKIEGLKPILRWAGGKTQLLPEIEKHMPMEYNHYFEPFVGAGAVVLYLQPEKATINDFNEDLVATYITIRDNVEELIELLKKHKEKNSKDYYYEIRDWDRQEFFKDLSSVEKAARVIYMNKTNFNGLFRVNSRGEFNVPYGHLKNPAILNEELLRNLSRYLNENKVKILSGDFEKAVKGAKAGDFVYFDPPYHELPGSPSFTAYQAGGFNEDEQKRLKGVMDRLTKKGVKVMLSNSYTPFIEELYKDYNIEIVYARRNINSNGNGRGAIKEVLVKNYEDS